MVAPRIKTTGEVASKTRALESGPGHSQEPSRHGGKAKLIHNSGGNAGPKIQGKLHKACKS